MEMRTWDEREQFLFPASFGVPKEIKSVEVTPKYEHKETFDTVQVSGIYHITCHVEFEEGEHPHHATSEFTHIEDLDVQGEVGYFEYAVPMSVEIAKEKIQKGSAPTLDVSKVQSKTTDNAAIEIAWSVTCKYEAPKMVEPEPEPVDVEVEEKVEVVEVPQESSVIESELQFILNLDDGMSKLTFPSNYVFVKQEAEE